MDVVVTRDEIVSIYDTTEAVAGEARTLMSLLSSYCRKKAQRVLRNLREPHKGREGWQALNQNMLQGTPQQRSSILWSLLR